MFNVTEQVELVVVSSLDTAYNFGFEDARNGEDAKGSMYYLMDSARWRSYNAGYVAGWRGDPMAVQWMVDGCPMPDSEFSDWYDVEPAEYRTDWVGA